MGIIVSMRAVIAIFAILLLAFGIFGHNLSDESFAAAAGASLRVGIVMAIWWLAYPQAQRLPLWLVVASAATLFIVLRWPKALLIIIPLLAILWFLGLTSLTNRPLFLGGIMMIIVGIQFISIGLLGEMISKTKESEDVYSIREYIP